MKISYIFPTEYLVDSLEGGNDNIFFYRLLTFFSFRYPLVFDDAELTDVGGPLIEEFFVLVFQFPHIVMFIFLERFHYRPLSEEPSHFPVGIDFLCCKGIAGLRSFLFRQETLYIIVRDAGHLFFGEVRAGL